MALADAVRHHAAVLGWLLASIALAALLARLTAGYPRAETGFRQLSRADAAFVTAAADAMFPSGGAVPVAGRDAGLPAYLERYLAALDPGKRRQVKLLLVFFEHAPLLFPAPGISGFRRFSKLSPEQREAVLRSWSESRWFPRRLVFAALRAVLGMGYLAHPRVMRHLHLAPFDFSSPVCRADLLYPRVGEAPESIAFTERDLTPPSAGEPLHPDGPRRPGALEPGGVGAS